MAFVPRREVESSGDILLNKWMYDLPVVRSFEVEKIHLFAATAMHPAAAAGNKRVADSQKWANACNDGRNLSIH